MSGTLDKTPTSLAAPVAPRTGKIIKNCFHVFERGENFYKMVYHTLYLKVKPIVRNRFIKLEFTQMKSGLF